MHSLMYNKQQLNNLFAFNERLFFLLCLHTLPYFLTWQFSMWVAYRQLVLWCKLFVYS